MSGAVHTGHGVMLNPPKRLLMSTMNRQRGRKSFSNSTADPVDLGSCIDIYSPEVTVNA